MHELSIADNIIRIVSEKTRQEQLGAVLRIRVQIGVMSGIEPECLRSAFAIASQGTAAEQAELECVVLPVRAECNECGNGFAVEEYRFICPDCQSGNVRMVAGNEMYIESLEVEE